MLPLPSAQKRLVVLLMIKNFVDLTSKARTTSSIYPHRRSLCGEMYVVLVMGDAQWCFRASFQIGVRIRIDVRQGHESIA